MSEDDLEDAIFIPFLLHHPFLEPARFPSKLEDLIADLHRQKIPEKIVNCFAEIDRALFTANPTLSKNRGIYADIPYRDTLVHLSAPSIYADVLTEFNDIGDDQRILVVGSGSGYFMSILRCYVGKFPYLVAIEVKKDLIEFSSEKVESVNFICGSVYDLDIENAPCEFDRIYIAAGCDKESIDFLLRILQIDGILIAPVENDDGSQTLLKISKYLNSSESESISEAASEEDGEHYFPDNDQENKVNLSNIGRYHAKALKSVMFAPLLDIRTSDKIRIPDQKYNRDTFPEIFQDRLNLLTKSPLIPSQLWETVIFPFMHRQWFNFY
jgi:protein-L-isoaspartate O-methyltransferase